MILLRARTSMSRSLLSIGLVSFSLLAFQLALMQVLSIMQWHHFAAMVIALAMLGFRASGTVLALVRDWAQRHADAVLPWAMVLAGGLMPLSVTLAQGAPFRFDSLKVFSDPHGLVGVFLTTLLVLLPFFLGAFAIGLMLARWPSRAPSLYFGNLVGSGARYGSFTGAHVVSGTRPASRPVGGRCSPCGTPPGTNALNTLHCRGGIRPQRLVRSPSSRAHPFGIQGESPHSAYRMQR